MLREALALSSHQPEFAHTRVFSLSYAAFAAAGLDNRRDAQRFGRSKRPGWSPTDTSTGRLTAPSRTQPEPSRTSYAVTTRRPRQLENVRRLHPLLRGVPWLNADLALRCADVSLDLGGDLAGALELAQVAGDALQGYPHGGTLPARLQRLEGRIRRGQDYGLTPAELRLVAFLPTHLSLQEIADRLYLARLPSRHTSRRSTTSSASQAGRKLSRISGRPASDRHKPKSRSQIT